MLVKAKYQLGYQGKLILGGEAFELEQKDYLQYQNDVEVLGSPREFRPIPAKERIKELKKEKTKQLKKRKVKTK